MGTVEIRIWSKSGVPEWRLYSISGARRAQGGVEFWIVGNPTLWADSGKWRNCTLR
jgi:hypothetical protein